MNLIPFCIGYKFKIVFSCCLGNRFHVCEGGSLYLYCPRGTYLVIFSANFGRLSSAICPGPGSNNVNCVSSNALSVVRNSCEGYPSCQLEAINNVFGDPCPGTYKYFWQRSCWKLRWRPTYPVIQGEANTVWSVTFTPTDFVENQYTIRLKNTNNQKYNWTL